MREASRKTHVNCWVCAQPIRKGKMKNHLEKADHNYRYFWSEASKSDDWQNEQYTIHGLPEKCLICGCKHPGSSGSHGLHECPFGIVKTSPSGYWGRIPFSKGGMVCPNNYFAPRLNTPFKWIDYSLSEQCFVRGCNAYVKHHIKSCKWICLYCKKECYGDSHEHFYDYNHLEHKQDLCTVYKRICSYKGCSEMLLPLEFTKHCFDSTLPNHLNGFDHTDHVKRIDQKVKDELIVKLKQLITDLTL